MCDEGKRVLALKLSEDEAAIHIGNFPSYFETFVEFALADPITERASAARSSGCCGLAGGRRSARAASISLLALGLLAAHLCHVGILWTEEGLPRPRPSRCSRADTLFAISG